MQVESYARSDIFCWGGRTRLVSADLELAELLVGRSCIETRGGVVTQKIAISEREGVAFAYTAVNTMQPCRFYS